MSNLGGYQKLTTCAKKVGGPIPLVLLIASSGAAIGYFASNGGKTLISKRLKAFIK